MIRTLIFGAIAGYVGKKLYDEGKLNEFKDDLVTRYNQVRGDINARSTDSGSSPGDSKIAVAPPPPGSPQSASAIG